MISNTSFDTISPLFSSNDFGISSKNTATNDGAAFIDIFTSAIDNVHDTEEVKNQFQYLLSVGELDNPAELTIAETRAQVAVDLMVQLRNKALEVHSGLMAIQL